MHAEVLGRLRARRDLVRKGCRTLILERWASGRHAAFRDALARGNAEEALRFITLLGEAAGISPDEVLSRLGTVRPDEWERGPAEQIRSSPGGTVLVEFLKALAGVWREVSREAFHQESARPLRIPLSFLARLTIDSPEITGTSGPLRLLPPWPAAEERRYREPRDVFTALDEVLCKYFEETLTQDAFKPLPYEYGLLRPYENLRAYFERLGTKEDRDQWLDRITRGSPAHLRIGETTYRLGPRIRKILPGPPMPSTIALAVLAVHRGTNTLAVKRRLQAARREDDLLRAWRGYRLWLAGQGGAEADLRACFEPYSVFIPRPKVAPLDVSFFLPPPKLV
jgi:hypothetical protein